MYMFASFWLVFYIGSIFNQCHRHNIFFFRQERTNIIVRYVIRYFRCCSVAQKWFHGMNKFGSFIIWNHISKQISRSWDIGKTEAYHGQTKVSWELSSQKHDHSIMELLNRTRGWKTIYWIQIWNYTFEKSLGTEIYVSEVISVKKIVPVNVCDFSHALVCDREGCKWWLGFQTTTAPSTQGWKGSNWLSPVSPSRKTDEIRSKECHGGWAP